MIPLPNCYGPGKAGIKSSSGCSGWDGIVNNDRKEKPSNQEDDSVAEDESTENVCFPLGFAVEKAKSARNGVDPEEADGTEGVASRGGSNRRKEFSTTSRERSDPTVSSRRLKLVMKGAIALAYDLGYICWVRESRLDMTGEDEHDWRVEDLEDLGKLILRAAGAESEKEKEERDKRKQS